MQVSVEAVGTLGRRLTVAVPADQFERAFADRLERLSRKIKMAGFRPGKVPAKVVEARYGGQLLEEAAGEIIERTLQEAIGSQKLRPAGGTRIRHKPLARGQELEYTAEFEIYPEITRLDLTGIDLERPVTQITEADVDRTLDTVRRQRVTWNPAQRPAQRDDRVLVDLLTRVDGAEFEGGKAQSHPVIIGSGALFPELEDGLVGSAVGETRNIKVDFPDDARNTALAGKAVEFEIHVNEIAEPVLPEVNEELAKTLGVEGGVDKLRADVRANLEREANGRTRAVLRHNVLKALREANRFEVPGSLVDAEAERMARIAQSVRGGSGAVSPPAENGVFRQRAGVRVALGLILAEIIRARGLKPDPVRVRSRVEDMARDYDEPQKFIEWYYANPERLGEVESTVLEERIVEELIGTANVQDRPMEFSELLKVDVSIE